MADLTINSILKATGATQVDDSSIADDGTTITVSEPITSTYASITALGAAIADTGSGGTDGSAILTVVGGTLAAGGTATQFNATITDGVLASIDSIVDGHNGPYTVVPSDPVSVTSDDAGPLSDATINIGWSFSPAIVGSDSASGFGFNADGDPQLNKGGAAPIFATVTDATTSTQFAPGLLITSQNGYFGLSIKPTGDVPGEPVFEMLGYTGTNYPVVAYGFARGTPDNPTGILSGDCIFEENFGGYGPNWKFGGTFQVKAAEDFAGLNGAMSLEWSTVDTTTESSSLRLVIDGSGNTKQQNGVFALDTGGSDAGIAIGSLPGAASAVPEGPGAGGTDGATVLTVVGGTGTPVQFNATIADGVLTAVGTIAVRGAMTSIPGNPVSVTSSDSGPLIGATIDITWLQTLGMMAVVNDATAPAVGTIVAEGGSAKAAVWWNGAQWTVWGI